jgi:hypothetical protein
MWYVNLYLLSTEMFQDPENHRPWTTVVCSTIQEKVRKLHSQVTCLCELNIQTKTFFRFFNVMTFHLAHNRGYGMEMFLGRYWSQQLSGCESSASQYQNLVHYKIILHYLHFVHKASHLNSNVAPCGISNKNYCSTEGVEWQRLGNADMIFPPTTKPEYLKIISSELNTH